MIARQYDALVLDVDGTLLDDLEQIHPRTRAALERAQQAGVVITLATGRSLGGARAIARELGLTAPLVVYNGAGVYCPVQDRLIETFTLPPAMVGGLLALARGRRVLPIVALPDGRQISRTPRTAAERGVLTDFRMLDVVSEDALPRAGTLRVTLLSAEHPDSGALHAEIRPIATPAYVTHCPLSILPRFRDSVLQLADVQPDCAGKAEIFRALHDRLGIPARRIVAVGDADNDLPMLRGAGLGVAMGNATPRAKRAAARVIGDNNGDGLGALIEELFALA